MTDESGLKAMFDAIPADIGIPKDVMDKARVALAYAQTQASETDTETAIAIIGKAIMAERERCAKWADWYSDRGQWVGGNIANAIRSGEVQS